jgi:phage/conjugal plasmid C-4 type zinc finger TraR family protein
MAGGWTRDGAVRTADRRYGEGRDPSRPRLTPQGESAEECDDCGEPIPKKRREALPGVRTCIACQSERDKAWSTRPSTAAAARIASCARRVSVIMADAPNTANARGPRADSQTRRIIGDAPPACPAASRSSISSRRPTSRRQARDRARVRPFGPDKIELKALLKDMADEGLIDIAPAAPSTSRAACPRSPCCASVGRRQRQRLRGARAMACRDAAAAAARDRARPRGALGIGDRVLARTEERGRAGSPIR